MYGPLLSPQNSRPSSVEIPRRTFSLPSHIKMPFYNSSATAPILPLSAIPANTSCSSSRRMSARKLSYGIKNRISHYPISLTIGGVLTLAIFFFIYTQPPPEFAKFNEAKLQLQSRSEFSDEEHQHRVHHVPEKDIDNGVGLLLPDEEELIAEDDLYWDSYTDPESLSEEEAAAEAEIEAQKNDAVLQNNIQSLRALIWWLAEGGILPNGWTPPSKAALKKMGGGGFEKMLADIDHGEDEQEIFETGWSDFANRRYRIAVFSKSYCPYSRNAKGILGQYHLSPAPFVIELDQRSDMDALQTILQRITGRRTVPNILLDFTSIGGSDDITLFHSEGGLQRRFEEMDVVTGSILRP